MATAKDKKTVTLTASVPVKDNTFTDLQDAKTFVGAPDDAHVNVGAGSYAAPSEDGTPGESFPYSVTFSWSEDK